MKCQKIKLLKFNKMGKSANNFFTVFRESTK